MDDFLQMYSHMSRTDLKKYRVKSMLSNALEDGENTVIWFYGARVNLNVMMRKFTEDADDDEETLPAEKGIKEAWQMEPWKSEYTYMAMSYKRCAQVQILIIQEKFDEAHRLMRDTISWFNRQVRNNRIREEYANGIRYLVDCLLAFCEVKNVKSTRSVEELKEDLERVTCYEELSDLEKCCVLGGRQFVRNILKFSINEQIDVLKKVSFDLAFWAWHLSQGIPLSRNPKHRSSKWIRTTRAGDTVCIYFCRPSGEISKDLSQRRMRKGA